jgi:hypothetical protein
MRKGNWPQLPSRWTATATVIRFAERRESRASGCAMNARDYQHDGLATRACRCPRCEPRGWLLRAGQPFDPRNAGEQSFRGARAKDLDHLGASFGLQPCIVVDHGQPTRRGSWCARRSPRLRRTGLRPSARHHGRPRNRHSSRSDENDPRGSLTSRTADQIVKRIGEEFEKVGYKCETFSDQ